MPQQTPTVSILIPAYNHPETLMVTLQSIKEQTYLDYEVIITDDSTDNGVETLASAFDKTMPISYHKNKVRLGTPANWNAALDLANGKYIKFLLHDDWFNYETALETFVLEMDKNPDANLGFSTANVINTLGEVVSRHRPSQEEVNSMLFNLLHGCNHLGGPSATIYRRNDIRFDCNLKWLVDVEFYIRVLKSNPNLVFINKDLINDLTCDYSVTSVYDHNILLMLYEHTYLKLKVAGML